MSSRLEAGTDTGVKGVTRRSFERQGRHVEAGLRLGSLRSYRIIMEKRNCQRSNFYIKQYEFVVFIMF